ncbi:permease [Synergistaceae bacterium OttesenSCG-928-I11]|nr:permease [Synergistaceae bacterium OttesenSCG-928-I11]
MMEIAQREFVYLWYYFTIQLDQILPYWALGILIGSTISVFGKNRIHSLLTWIQDKRLGALGVIPASALGIASPLCMYGTIPIAASFSQKGVRDDWLAAFMMSSVLLNPQLLMYSAVLGKTALVVRLISCFVCGAVAGLCVRFFFNGKSFFNFSGFAEQANRDTDPNLAIRLLKNIWRNVRVTGPYFLVGIALTALFQRYVPQEAVAWVFGGFGESGGRKGFGILMAAALGVPLYACGGGTIPLLLDWMNKGMGMGSAAAFMITGPATKITNLGALKIVLGARHFSCYLVFTLCFAFVTGAIVDVLV